MEFSLYFYIKYPISYLLLSSTLLINILFYHLYYFCYALERHDWGRECVIKGVDIFFFFLGQDVSFQQNMISTLCTGTGPIPTSGTHIQDPAYGRQWATSAAAIHFVVGLDTRCTHKGLSMKSLSPTWNLQSLKGLWSFWPNQWICPLVDSHVCMALVVSTGNFWRKCLAGGCRLLWHVFWKVYVCAMDPQPLCVTLYASWILWGEKPSNFLLDMVFSLTVAGLETLGSI